MLNDECVQSILATGDRERQLASINVDSETATQCVQRLNTNHACLFDAFNLHYSHDTEIDDWYCDTTRVLANVERIGQQVRAIPTCAPVCLQSSERAWTVLGGNERIGVQLDAIYDLLLMGYGPVFDTLCDSTEELLAKVWRLVRIYFENTILPATNLPQRHPIRSRLAQCRAHRI
jgi:hypothetical protein